jgi:predicted MFS family arabinose efflux permease
MRAGGPVRVRRLTDQLPPQPVTAKISGIGSLSWILNGVGAIVGPADYGFLADRLGFSRALRVVLLVQTAAVAVLAATHSIVAVGVLSVVIGTFPPGIVPLVLGRVNQILPGAPQAQGAAWGRATTTFALFQALSGYIYSYVFDRSGQDHRLLFVIGAFALVLALGSELASRPLRDASA